MARTYKLISAGPMPNNPLQLTTTIEVSDDATGETFKLENRIFGNNLTAEKLAELIGELEARTMAPRASALASLTAAVGRTITPTAPAAPDTAKADYQRAEAKLAELDRLVQLKIIDAAAKEYTDALAAVKTARGKL